jgi:heat shock protein HtpX
MDALPPPVLVYDRIDANRRRTRTLLGALALALLPVVSGATVWCAPLFTIPLMFALMALPDLAARIAEWDLRELAMLEGGVWVLSLLAATLGLCAIAVFLVDRFGSALVLHAARARRAHRDEHPEVHRAVENLCIGAGLPQPRIFVIDSPAANAFATGKDPERASLAVTRGLLERLDRRELEAALAHELSHVGNRDAHLATLLAAVMATLTLPLGLLAALFRRHRLLALAGCVLLLPVVTSLLMVVGFLFSDELRDLPPFLRWWIVHAIAAPFYVVLGAPGVACLLTRAVGREREFLADADAVLLTRNPDALAVALLKASSAAEAAPRVGVATAHLYLVDPNGGEARGLARWLHSHPPLRERLDRLVGMGARIREVAAA